MKNNDILIDAVNDAVMVRLVCFLALVRKKRQCVGKHTSSVLSGIFLSVKLVYQSDKPYFFNRE